MKKENKIPLSEVHRQLNDRAGREVSASDFEDLLWCWRRYAHKTRAGKEGWLSRKNASKFLDYAYYSG